MLTYRRSKPPRARTVRTTALAPSGSTQPFVGGGGFGGGHATHPVSSNTGGARDGARAPVAFVDASASSSSSSSSSSSLVPVALAPRGGGGGIAASAHSSSSSLELASFAALVAFAGPSPRETRGL